MCRQMVFSGTCPQCTQHFIWRDLSQELSCLEAKNTGVFGQCTFGVQIEEHRFDQECEPCAAENERDEGVYCAADADGDTGSELCTPGELISDPNKQPFTTSTHGKKGHLLDARGKKHAEFEIDADGVQREEDGGRRKKQRVA
ncbi:hypothetical protein SMAC4_12921 [Sordaria macrospora]|uniref:uncharacterized protein n=1 Tax=Sordaria macrospora TaxID=5147 RepID=UPI001D941309|nr:hypothetical protein B0T09DRAFT_274282 [Sordaria sp. MPI-SDFR-AT-0083]WPJ65103.1 hypothetical protein SMAC4_12921 [Sordaria macrospora]